MLFLKTQKKKKKENEKHYPTSKQNLPLTMI